MFYLVPNSLKLVCVGVSFGRSILFFSGVKRELLGVRKRELCRIE